MVINEIEIELRDALARLYDPGFQPSGKLCELLGCENKEKNVSIQYKIIQGIEALKPAADVPKTSRIYHYYEILHNRFVLRLTLEETSLRMHMSLSSTWREQRAAIHSLAAELWQQGQVKANQEGKELARLRADEKEDSASQTPDWMEQTRRELASLQSQAPDAVAEVGSLVKQIIELEKDLCAKRGIVIEAGAIKQDLVARVHPSVFRQILIIAIGKFLRHMNAGKISLFGRLEDGIVKITVAAAIDIDPDVFVQMLTAELPLPDDVFAEIYQDGKQVFLWVKLPALADRLNVLVVDDNMDMVHYYQRSTEGSNYRIVPWEIDLDLFSTIQKVKPDIIVLDVMLPNVDGWELLMQIRANSLTRSIPVIICSVVKEEELALSLGAMCFLSKPVSSEKFVRTLDQVLSQTP
jgi:CheY-like chemotaxis protein